MCTGIVRVEKERTVNFHKRRQKTNHRKTEGAEANLILIFNNGSNRYYVLRLFTSSFRVLGIQRVIQLYL